MSFLQYFEDFNPDQEIESKGVLKVNNHLHTPFSFSAFEEPEEALDQALEEDVRVVGVNDFFSFDAYETWCNGAFERGLFPLFNVEFIGLKEADQKAGLKVNDPGNPGRTYFSGKSLAFPLVLSAETLKKINSLVDEANAYVREMTTKVNDFFKSKKLNYSIDFDEMQMSLARNQVRERHLARAIRILGEKKSSSKEHLLNFYLDLFGFKELTNNIDEATMENELRNALLKAGKPAYVEEDPNGFLDTNTIRSIILEAGGIPTYPFLGDAVKGFTDFERAREKTAALLKERGIWSVEFIPTRNELSELKEYVNFLHSQGFVVSFGTEHNAPGKQPVEVFAKGHTPLDQEMMKINYEGACILAAHQYLFAKEGEGILDAEGVFKQEKRAEYTKLGDALIHHATSKKQ